MAELSIPLFHPQEEQSSDVETHILNPLPNLPDNPFYADSFTDSDSDFDCLPDLPDNPFYAVDPVSDSDYDSEPSPDAFSRPIDDFFFWGLEYESQDSIITSFSNQRPLLVTEPNTDSGLRVTGIDSESDLDPELNNGVVDIESGNTAGSRPTRVRDYLDTELDAIWGNLSYDPILPLAPSTTNDEDFGGWEEINRRIQEESSSLSSLSNSSVTISAQESEWEFLLSVNTNPNLNVVLFQNPNERIEDSAFLLDDILYEVLFGPFPDEDEIAWRGSPPAARAVVESLPLEELGEEATCPVCKDDIAVEVKVIMLPCHHFFHDECILTWLSIGNTCPVCRFELPTDDDEYERRRQRRRMTTIGQ